MLASVFPQSTTMSRVPPPPRFRSPAFRPQRSPHARRPRGNRSVRGGKKWKRRRRSRDEGIGHLLEFLNRRAAVPWSRIGWEDWLPSLSHWSDQTCQPTIQHLIGLGHEIEPNRPTCLSIVGGVISSRWRQPQYFSLWKCRKRRRASQGVFLLRSAHLRHRFQLFSPELGPGLPSHLACSFLRAGQWLRPPQQCGRLFSGSRRSQGLRQPVGPVLCWAFFQRCEERWKRRGRWALPIWPCR